MSKLLLPAIMSLLFVAPLGAQEPTITIRGGLLLDGKGGAHSNVDVVTQGPRS